MMSDFDRWFYNQAEVFEDDPEWEPEDEWTRGDFMYDCWKDEQCQNQLN